MHKVQKGEAEEILKAAQTNVFALEKFVKPVEADVLALLSGERTWPPSSSNCD